MMMRCDFEIFHLISSAQYLFESFIFQGEKVFLFLSVQQNIYNSLSIFLSQVGAAWSLSFFYISSVSSERVMGTRLRLRSSHPGGAGIASVTLSCDAPRRLLALRPARHFPPRSDNFRWREGNESIASSPSHRPTSQASLGDPLCSLLRIRLQAILPTISE